jgi:hypothetical protein
MTDTFTPSLQLDLQATGGNASTWGMIANVQYQKLEAAITGDNGYAGGAGGISLTGLTTLALTSTNGAVNQSSQLLYPFVGSIVATCTVTIPGVLKIGWAANFTSGGSNVILTTGGGAALTLPPNSSWTMFYCDGTNVTAPGVGFGTNGATGMAVDQYGDITVGYNAGEGGNITAQGAITGSWVAGSFGTFTSAGTTLATATLLQGPLTAPFWGASQTSYVVNTVANAGVRLNPNTPVGTIVEVLNNSGSNPLFVYPPNSSSNINGFAAGLPHQIIQGSVLLGQRFWRLTTLNWFTL